MIPASRVAEQILVEHPIAKGSSRRLLVKVDGQWTSGEDDVFLIVAQRLGSEWSKRRGYEVVDFIRTLAPVIEETA